MKMGVLKNQVLYCLEQFPETRNSDIKLTNCIWLTYYRDYLTELDGEHYVKLLSLYALPNQDDIKRIRAKIQNREKKYLPTSSEVAKKRHWQEEEWRSVLGYNPELRTI